MIDRKRLNRFGWVVLETPLTSTAQLGGTMLEVAETLGEITFNRGRALVNTLIPLGPGEAHPKSLSALTGLGVQPWHVDLAHRQTPARYILLGCEAEGVISADTELCDREGLLQGHNLKLAYTEPFLVKSGRCSFYSTVLTKGEEFIRIDPGCMVPMTEEASCLMAAIQDEESRPIITIRWKRGLIAVIDNWRMLHRRMGAYGAEGRKLLRVSVLGESHVGTGE